MRFNIESYGISDIGLVRPNNEDEWAVVDARFFALADGMGGHKAGEVAAKIAIITLCQAINHKNKSSIPEEIEHLKKAIANANSCVNDLAKENEDLKGMGTTLCCLLLHEDTLIYAHVGDSRIYRFRKELAQLTQDHSLRYELIAKGQLDEDQAFPFKNVITRAVGTASAVTPEVGTTTIQEGDIYFLCSDGLSDYVKNREITDILERSKTVKEACHSLVDAAKANGGNDNITVVMIKAHETNISR